MSTIEQFDTTAITLNKRLTRAMKQRGITITQLSEKAKIAVGTIQRLMTDPNCNPTVSSLEAISKVLDITICELIGEEQKVQCLLGKSVHIFSWEEITHNIENLKSMILRQKDSLDIVKTSTKLSSHSFGLRMKDDSMIPVFPQNCLLIFDLTKIPYNNSFVLVWLSSYQSLVFRQLILDEPYRYIKSVNPLLRDNLTKLETHDIVLSTLVEAKIQY